MKYPGVRSRWRGTVFGHTVVILLSFALATTMAAEQPFFSDGFEALITEQCDNGTDDDGDSFIDCDDFDCTGDPACPG